MNTAQVRSRFIFDSWSRRLFCGTCGVRKLTQGTKSSKTWEVLSTKVEGSTTLSRMAETNRSSQGKSESHPSPNLKTARLTGVLADMQGKGGESDESFRAGPNERVFRSS